MAITTGTRTVVGVFNSIGEANRVVQELVNLGVSRDDISLVANKNVSDQGVAEGYDPTENIGQGAGIGAAIGGAGGLLLSLAGLTIPGIGPILAAGPLVAALGGAGIGATVGSIIGALTNLGIPEEDARHYAEGVRRGDVLVTVRAEGDMADRVQSVMDDHGAVDVNDRVSNWQGRGYTGWSDNAPAYSPDELRNERSYYGNTNTYGTTDTYNTSTGSLRNDADRAANRVADSTAYTADRVADSTRNVGNRLEDSTRRTGRDLKEGVQDAGYAIEDKTRDAGRAVKHFGTEVKEGVEDAGRSIRRGAARIYDRATR